MLSVAHRVDSGDRVGLPRQAANTALKHSVVSVFVYEQILHGDTDTATKAVRHLAVQTPDKSVTFTVSHQNICPLRCFRMNNSDHFCSICGGRIYGVLYYGLPYQDLLFLLSLRAGEVISLVFIWGQYRHFSYFILSGLEK